MTTVTKDKPFWAVHGLNHDPRAVEFPLGMPNHTLCGFFDLSGGVYALNHEKRVWVGLNPLAAHEWCYDPVVDWICYPGTPEYDRIVAATTAAAMGAHPSLVTDVTRAIAREHGYG